MMGKISLVVSVYNEAEVLTDFYEETMAVLQNLRWSYELIFVNDGSIDGSRELLGELAEGNEHVKVIHFSKNFGHEAAMIAGIDYSTGDGVVCMDADLQHPPELIVDIIERFEAGYEVINMTRTKNHDTTLAKKLTSALFYKMLNILSPIHFEENASDFFAVSQKAAGVLKSEYREKARFLRGYVQSIGFSKTTIEYEAQVRRAGESKYSIKKLIQFSANALVSFSDMPLKLGLYTGILSALLGLVVMVYSVYMKLSYGTPSGYTTIITVICFMFAVQFIIIGIIGQYLSILFTEMKNRPIYIVQELINIDEKMSNETHKFV